MAHAIRVGSVVMAGVIVGILAVRAMASNPAVDAHLNSKPAVCSAADLNFDSSFDPSTDVNATENFDAAIAELLKEGKFDDLDCIADSLRSSKSKFSGGAWKIHNFYAAFDGPQGHATEEDWKNFMDPIERWVAAKQASVTARVALAESYASYAWYARGNGTSDSVTGSGWKLFGQRLDKAKETLDEAAKLQQKCPEWYVVMQRIAMGQNWNVPQETALFEQAIAFEPSYYYYYRMHANFILPKWNGEEGDSTKFAEKVADHMGGKQGDILYFEIAVQLVCRCDEPEFSHMSWPRVQRGYAELEKEYGTSLINLNEFALMALKAKDPESADLAFKRIGDSWDKDTWGSESFFKANQSWAAATAPGQARFRAIRSAADANMQTAQGVRYKKDFEQKFAKFMQPCVQNAGSDLEKFEFMIKVGKQGTVEGLWMPDGTVVAVCLFQTLSQTELKKEKVFPRPPQPSYVVDLKLDPASFLVASK
jgi:hypothetical protein